MKLTEEEFIAAQRVLHDISVCFGLYDDIEAEEWHEALEHLVSFVEEVKYE